MIAFENRKYIGVSLSLKREMLMALMNSNTVVRTGSCTYGNIEPDGNSGLIEEVDSGVWGFGGDVLAVYVNGTPYPSSAIIELNVGIPNTDN